MAFFFFFLAAAICVGDGGVNGGDEDEETCNLEAILSMVEGGVEVRRNSPRNGSYLWQWKKKSFSSFSWEMRVAGSGGKDSMDNMDNMLRVL